MTKLEETKQLIEALKSVSNVETKNNLLLNDIAKSLAIICDILVEEYKK